MSNLNEETKTVPNKEEEYEDEEEALSLCDFPLNCDDPERNSKTHHHRRSSSQPSEYAFEFSNDPNSDNMSHAEDIIHCGKLVPYRQQQQQQQPLFDDQILKSLSTDYDSANFSRRYCDSLPTSARSNSTRLTRSSRSLDRKKLRRNSSLVMKSEASDIHRSLSKGLVKSEAASKPRWYDLMFGPVKLPPEMDLQDMKNRQVRRSPGIMFPAADGGGRDGRSSWGHDLLRVLSCKNHSSSVAVTASIRLVPQLWITWFSRSTISIGIASSCTLINFDTNNNCNLQGSRMHVYMGIFYWLFWSLIHVSAHAYQCVSFYI